MEYTTADLNSKLKLEKDILNAIKAELNTNRFDAIYSVSPQFIAKYYIELFVIVTNATCSDKEKVMLMNHLNSEHKKFRDQQETQTSNKCNKRFITQENCLEPEA